MHRLGQGEVEQLRAVLMREPGLGLFRTNFMSLLDSASENDWRMLFDLYTSRTTESDLVRVLGAALRREGELGGWVSNELIPQLIGHGSILPSFLKYLANETESHLIQKVVGNLSSRCVSDLSQIHSLVQQWDHASALEKRKLLSNVIAGVRIGAQSTGPGSMVSNGLLRVQKICDDWAQQDWPKLDSAIQETARIPIPEALAPSREGAKRLFANRGTVAGPDVALVLGANPWVLEVMFSDTEGVFPKSEFIAEHIAQRFAHISKLKVNAEDALRNLSRSLREGLGAALREILSDIESEIAPYFVFREVLRGSGLNPVMEKLGAAVDPTDLSSERHKVIRDPQRPGALRVFGLGIEVDDKIISSGLIMSSGAIDDRD
jgi:hypothetical protein